MIAPNQRTPLVVMPGEAGDLVLRLCVLRVVKLVCKFEGAFNLIEANKLVGDFVTKYARKDELFK